LDWVLPVLVHRVLWYEEMWSLWTTGQPLLSLAATEPERAAEQSHAGIKIVDEGEEKALERIGYSFPIGRVAGCGKSGAPPVGFAVGRSHFGVRGDQW
jgi:hypothetical protein